MSSSPHNWSRKRPAEDDLEDISDQERKDESSWKVKTLDEILQEKRKRLEDETGGKEEKEVTDEREESQPASRNSSATASPGSLKREKIAPNQLESPAAEVIYHLSPGQHSCSSLSSGGATPGNNKALVSHEVSKSHQRLKRGQTEEEEGEIVSDGSDHEDETKSKSKGIRKASVSNIEVKDPESTEKEKQGASEKVDSDNGTDDDEDSDDDDESSDNESEEKEDLPSAQKSQQDVIQNRSEKDQNGESEESEESDESDSESDDESEAESSEEEEEDEASLETKNNKEKVIEKVGKKDENDDDDDDDDDDDSDEEDEDEDDDDSDEQSESEDDSSEESESENEQVEKQSSVKDPSKSGEHDDEEDEDLHKELLQATESRKQKERAKKQERYATDKPRRERPYSYDDHRSKEYTYSKDSRRHHEREKRQMEERVDKSYLSREKSYEKRDPRYKEKNNEQSSGSRKGMEKSYSKEIDVSKEKLKEKYHTSSRSSKRDSGKSKRKSPRESDSRKDTKLSEKPVKETKNSSDYRRESREDKRRKQHDKQKEIEKSFKGERAAVSKDIGSSILTEYERKQFNQEVVDFESDEGSSTDENAPGSLARDVEMLSDKEEEKEPEKPKLPLYLPAIRGCRNVEEFQWLNRIEEGTFGVVYRAKDKRTGEIVALKRLKMEKEKEGFPITSLREINTLLKAQHPNIVTVREIVVGSNMDKIYIVMDYVEHDLKVLMEHMPNPFLAGEVKTLMIQLLRAVAHLHDNWILHRDLKTSNLLLSNKGILKVGDFGLAREYGSPLRHYTPIVVTLWYRAPELLLGVKEYSCPIDLWSVGCIFAELLTMKPLFPGVSEIDQINKIFKELGTPSDKIWPGPPSYSELPAVKKVTFTEYPYNNLRNKFGAYLTDKGFDLLNRFLTYDPKKRITAEQALEHGFFDESPLPVDPSMFPSWPAKSELVKRPRRKNYEHSPKAPEGGASFAKLGEDDSGGFHIATLKKGASKAPGFSLKF